MTRQAEEPPRDRLRRPLRDLRVSVTDRCNFRCGYCMPRDVFGPGYPFLPRGELLTFEEVTRAVRALTPLGVRKVRLTGGEPLLRHDLPELVAMLAGVDGVEDLAMTTNGALLAPHAAALRAAGLRRLTVSLDSLDPDTFQAMADTTIGLQTVLAGVDAALEAGFSPVKLNTVVRRGVNDDGVLDLVAYARERGLVLRFIEYMDVGMSNGWRLDEVVPAADLVRQVAEAYPLEPLEPAVAGEVARRYRFTDGAGELGVIASVTEPFCGSCTRLRMTALGELFTCLFAATGHDLRGLLRSGADDAEVAAYVEGIWRSRADRYSELRRARTRELPRVEMSYLGG